MIRALVIAAVAAGALALPNAAAAESSAGAPCLTPVVPCVQEAVNEVLDTCVTPVVPCVQRVIDRLYCAGSCVDLPLDYVVHVVQRTVNCVVGGTVPAC